MCQMSSNTGIECLTVHCVLNLTYSLPPRIQNIKTFIIHTCDPTVVICYLILPCDMAVHMAVHITYLISHSSSLKVYIPICAKLFI